MTQIKKRIGFACKLSKVDNGNVIAIPEYNFKTTTVAWLNRQHKDVAVQRLWDLMKDNIEAAKKLVAHVGNFEDARKMVRLGSDLLPVYTHQDWAWFWRTSDVRAYCERELEKVGIIARERDVRLSMHPGQFVVLASENPGIVIRSMEEFEYHVDLARWMGYGKTFQDFKINVHISGKRGPDGIRESYKKLSAEARNCITIENEENSWGLNDCLELGKLLPIVLDVHHHWVREGEYLDINDIRVNQVVDSWRGVRPTMHYSVSREDYLVDHDKNALPDYALLLENGFKKQKLRAHSDFYWNSKVNEWALGFWDKFDIMSESKCKNIASSMLLKEAKQLGL